MSAFLRKISRFYRCFLIKYLTNTCNKAPNLLETGSADVSQAVLSRSFTDYARATLPGGLTTSGFRHEKYTGVGPNGPEQTIHELLANVNGQNNEIYFANISKNKMGVEVDRYLIFKALDHAQEKKLFPVALNVYLHSAYSYEFIDNVVDYLDEHNIEANNVIFELLEYDEPATEDDLSALGYACDKRFRFAIDDFDPRDERQIARLERLSPYSSFLKFDKKIFDDIREETNPVLREEKLEVVRNAVEVIRIEYPHLQLIAEGVDQKFIKTNNLGFEKTQNSGWGDLEP